MKDLPVRSSFIILGSIALALYILPKVAYV